MSYAELSDPSPVLPALVESKVSCSRCGEKFELGQQVRDNNVYYNTGELKSIEHLHDPPCEFRLWDDSPMVQAAIEAGGVVLDVHYSDEIEKGGG
jgi:hypothetical protein